MSHKLTELRKAKSPLANEERILEIDQDINRYAAIAAFNDSEGGQELRKALRSDIVSAINTLISTYKLAELSNMQAMVAIIDARINLIIAMGNAKQNKEDAEKILDELTS